VKQISTETEKAFNSLKKYLSSLESAAVAYSGGVDSTLLLYTASVIPGLNLKAYTVKNAMIPEEEVTAAINTAEQFGIDHQLIDIDILSFEKITSNTPERCYHCKSVILKEIIKSAAAHGISVILEGTHSGDMNDYRPGLKAINELGVISPLKNAGFDKNRIYELSAYLDLPTSGKESYPCLATRIPYGTHIIIEDLKKAETAEKIIASFGFRKIRARIHGDILRIEIDEKMITDFTADTIRKEIYSALQNAGFTYITLDLQGYRTGSMNIQLEGLQ
jgi:uncharacterized protein